LGGIINQFNLLQTIIFQELDTAKEVNKTLKDKLRKENRKSRHLTEKKENFQTQYFEVIE
jgi:hypothetical protein